MQKIVTHLWFDREAIAAAEFYVAAFPDSRITHRATLGGTPGGDTDIVSFDVCGHAFMAISAGPMFRINPSISHFVNFDPSRDPNARTHLDETWKKLIDGGTALMPLDRYPFSEWYGWVQDRFGVSWQLILTNPAGEPRPMIVPSMLFTGDVAGKAEEASNFYASIFRNSRHGTVARYPAGMAPDREGTIMYSDFALEDQWFAAMDSARQHDFRFNEATSFLVNCADQQEIDYLWHRLSAVPASEQCGWLKDRYGVSWQIQPRIMNDMLANGTSEQIARVTQAFLPMKKFDVAALQAAYDGR